MLHVKLAPLIRRRSGTTNTSEHMQFNSTPKVFGPGTKFSTKDEFLLTLMKLRLGLVIADLAHPFGISGGLCTKIFYFRIRGSYIEIVLATFSKKCKASVI